ncbi:MAG: HDOD domain-containing protein [Planctomycetota bacterium]
MDFVCGSLNALEYLSENEVDVVVSDVRMPELDGAVFLTEVARLYPSVVRLVLSGQAEKEKIFSLVGIAHQYFAKPFSADRLYSAITNIQSRRFDLGDEKTVCWINQLPVVPVDLRIFGEMREALDCGRCDISKLAEILQKDPGLATRVLQLVNSCYFGPQVKGCSLEKACELLGTDIIKDLSSRTMLFTAMPWVSRSDDDGLDATVEIGRRVCAGNSDHDSGNQPPDENRFRAAGEYLLELWGIVLPEGFELLEPEPEPASGGMISPQVEWQAGRTSRQTTV